MERRVPPESFFSRGCMETLPARRLPTGRQAGGAKGNGEFKIKGAQLKLAATNSTARSKAGVLKPAATTSTARLPWRQTCRTARSGCATGTIQVLRSSIRGDYYYNAVLGYG